MKDVIQGWDSKKSLGAMSDQWMSRRVVPGGGGGSVSADISAAVPQDGGTPMQRAVDQGRSSAAQLLRALGAQE